MFEVRTRKEMAWSPAVRQGTARRPTPCQRPAPKGDPRAARSSQPSACEARAAQRPAQGTRRPRPAPARGAFATGTLAQHLVERRGIFVFLSYLLTDLLVHFDGNGM